MRGGVGHTMSRNRERERKRRVAERRETVRGGAEYIASRDNIDSSSGSWQMFKEDANGGLVPPEQ